jgi:regulator of sigma E protease
MADGPGVTVRKLDPVLLPLELKKWADGNPVDRKFKLVILRTVGHKENDPVELELTFDDSYRDERVVVSLPNSPVPLSGLGLAYWIQPVVDEVEPNSPAAKAGLKPGDLITAVRFKTKDYDGTDKTGSWDEIKAHQWASVDSALQSHPPYQMDLKVKRGNDEMELPVAGEEDKNWPMEDRGLIFQQDFRTQKAADIGEALNLGARRTLRFIQEVYMNLYAMIFGRVSAKTMSGPLTIANVSYRFAGEDFWQFLLFIGMISVNLAVVNFLPIPVLDGGHMVFLILEKILGRPVPEKVFAFAMYLGLAMILSLMIFVITLDIRRLFFGWF